MTPITPATRVDRPAEEVLAYIAKRKEMPADLQLLEQQLEKTR